MIQVDCPLCRQPCRMETATSPADERILRCEDCRIEVELADPRPLFVRPVPLAA